MALFGLAGLALCALVVSPEPPAGGLDAWFFHLLRAVGLRLTFGVELALAFIAGAGALTLGILYVLGFLDRFTGRSAERKRWRQKTARQWIGLLIVVGALIAVPRFMGAFLASRGTGAAGGQEASSGQEAPASSSTTIGSPALGDWHDTPRASPLLLGLIAAGGALVIGLSIWALVSLRSGKRSKASGKAANAAEEAERAAAGFAAARRLLETGDEARDAIIASYARMCEIFAGSNRADGPRGAGGLSGTASGNDVLTAREFAALLGKRGVKGPEVPALTAAFEKARYSNEPCAESDRASAREALRAIEEKHAAASGGGHGRGRDSGHEGGRT